MQAEPSTTDKMAALYMIAKERREGAEQLHTRLYEASLAVIACWERGDLAEAVNELRRATEEISESYDEEAVIEAGWDRRGALWCRFTSKGEVLDPELDSANVWILNGVIHCRHASDALTQDDYAGMGR